MKNFFKKLSFVLAVAMVLTSIAPATASAASKNFVTLKGSNKAITSVTAWIGGVTRNLDYSIDGETSGVKGTWKSSNTDAVKVNAKTGVITPVANGSATVTFTTADGEVAKVAVKARTRAASLNIYDAAEYAAGTKAKLDKVEMTVGDAKELKVTMPMYKKATAAGAKRASYYSYAEVADETVVTVAKNNNRSYTMTAKAAGETTVTIVANQTTQKNVRNNKYYVEASFTVVVADAKAELTAEQTGTNKITVTGSDLTDNVADYTLKFGTATKTLKSVVELNEAKTVAVIEVASSTLVEGDYTITFGEDVAELKCEPSKVASIVLDPENAIYVTSTSAVAYYTVYNQFNEDVTKKAFGDLNISGSDNVGTNSTTAGKLEFVNTTNGYNLNLSQVSVSIVDKATATVCSKVLVVSEESKLHEVNVAGLYKIQGGSYVKVDSIPEGTTDKQIVNYKLLVNGVDQYGLEYPVEKIDNKSLSMILSSATGLAAKVADAGAVVPVEIDDVKYAVVDLEVNNTDKVLSAGTVGLSGVVLTSGNQFASSIVVTDAVKIDSISISAPDGVYGGQWNVLSYTILDTEGNEVTDIDTLCQLNHTDFMKEFGKVMFVGSKDGTAVLKYWAESTNYNSVDTISWITPTLKYGYAQLNIKPDRKPVAVVGVWSPAETGYKSGANVATTANGTTGSIRIGLKDYKYEDQYGNMFAWWEYDGFVKDEITVTTATEGILPEYLDEDPNCTAGFVASATAIATSSTIKVKVNTSIKLPNASNETRNEYAFTVAFAALNDVAGIYGYTYAPQYYATADAEVFHALGGFYAGKSVDLKPGYDYVTVDSTASAINADESGYNVVLDDSVTSVVKNSVGTVVKTDIKKSNALGKVDSADAYADGYPFNGGYVTVVAGTPVIGQLTRVFDKEVGPEALTHFGQIVKAKDQYGTDTYVAAPTPADLNSARVTFSNLPADYTKYTLDGNGTTGCSLTFNTAGWYTVKATFDWADGNTYTATLVFEVNAPVAP